MILNFYFSYLFYFKELIIVINSDFIRLNCFGFFFIFYRLVFLNGNDRKKLIFYMGKCKFILVKFIEICLNMFNLICSDIYISVKN